LEWNKNFPEVKRDNDNLEHMKVIYERSLERAIKFKIEGVTEMLTMGVAKNIIPAIASTNALIAAFCTN
jgi:ubiquitin-activating enzyme E1 C